MTNEAKGRFRQLWDWMNDDYGDTPAFIKWLAVTMVVLLTPIIGSCQLSYWFYDLPAQRAVIACQAKGQNAARVDFSHEIVCLPRYRGADSLNATLQTK